MSKRAIEPIAASPVLEMLPPYPIVLVSTRDNVITVNQLAYLTFRPLRIGIGIARVRHTHELLKAEQEFVVNIPGADLVDKVQLCGSISGRDGDKFAAAGLDREPCEVVQAAAVAQCAAQIECQVEREMAFEERTWFIGRVVAARKAESHSGAAALMCGRDAYRVAGEAIAER